MMETLIFDLDGTLLDSMHVWDDVPQRYCERTTIPYDPHMLETFSTMSLTQTAHCLQQVYGVTASTATIIDDINACVEEKYRKEVQLKPGAKEFLAYLHSLGKNITLLTACNIDLAKAALQRNGVLSYFDAILTCELFGYSKTETALFHKAVQYIHTDTSSCVFIEDSLHAIEHIREAGYTVWGIYDSYNKQDWESIKNTCDVAFTTYKEMERYI